MSELTLRTLLIKRKNELKKDYNKQENYLMAKMITVYESSDGARLYETSDGTYHKSRDAAKQHKELLELEAYVNANRIYTNTEVIDGAEFMEWLQENPRIHIQLLPEEL